MPTPEEILAQYEKLALHEANEAETRLKVINDVLYSVLGWTHADVKVEERVSEDGQTTWADYVLRTGMTAFVVEAKKVGVALVEAPNVRRAQLAGKFVSGATGEAIIQARDYARKLSLPFAVVTNGDRWIIFPATRVDGVSFKDSSAIVFGSLKSALQDDYAEFYDLLSRKAVIGGSLENELLGRIENQIEDRRLNRFFTSSFSRISRHSLFPLIEDAVATAFTEDVVNADAGLLEKCYVKTPERVRFDHRIKLHIAKRRSVTLKAAMRPLREKDAAVVAMVTGAAARARPLALLVLGQVGAGKTTFLEYTKKVGAKEVFEPDSGKAYPHWMYIDFRSYSSDQSSIRFLCSSLKELINLDPFLNDYERCTKHAYKAEFDALFKGPLYLLAHDEGERKRRITSLLMADYEQTQPYVEKVLKYVAENAPVFLIIDNVDQFEDEEVQARIFGDAMSLAQKLKLNLVCSMREATYVKHKATATFDAFDFDPITIDPPNIQAVLSNRFFVARNLLRGKSVSFTAENGALVHVSDLGVVIDLVQASVLGTELGNLIEVLATSDVRLALRMTREFLRSGWTASGKALRVYQATGKYRMPQHEALRAIMIGSQQVYFEEFSVLGNPFDSRLAKSEAQLLRLYVLAAIVNLSSERSFRHLEGEVIRDSVREIGFGDDLVKKVLEDLCRLRFMHTTSHDAPTFQSNYVVSRLGGYIVRHFIADMMYLENVMMDTFIADDEVWRTIKEQTSAIYAERDIIERVRKRKIRCETFYLYMRALYDVLHNESIRRGLPKEWCTNPIRSAQRDFELNLTRAMSSARRSYGAQSQITVER
jgi:GTPase SAR1 family protein